MNACEVLGIEDGEAGNADEVGALDGFVDEGLDVAVEEFWMAALADAGREFDGDGLGLAGDSRRGL